MLDSDRPRSNIFRGMAVSIFLMAALLASEAQSFPVGGRDMAAGMTPTACVFRANRFQFNSYRRGLVFDLESGIGIRPSVEFGSQVFPLTQRTVSDVREFFHDYAPCADFNRVFDQCLRCDMQEVPRYGCLVAAHAPEKAVSGTSANGLDSSASAPDASAAVIQHPAVEEKGFGISRVGGNQHPFDAHIDAHKAPCGFKFWNLNLMSQTQKPLFAYSFDLGVLARAFRKRSGIRYGQKFAPKRKAFLGAIEVSLPHYRQYGASELCPPPTLVRLAGFVSRTNNLAERAGQLRRQAHIPEIGIVRPRQSVRIQFLGFESDSRKPVGSFPPNSKQSVSLCAARNFDLNCAHCFHCIRYHSLSKTMSTESSRKNHNVSRLLVHQVFVVKYRHAIISDAVWTSLRCGLDLSAKRLNLTLVELNHDKDHVHLVVEYPPKVNISELVNARKGNSSFGARRDCKDELRKKLRGSAFWSPSFFAASCGGAPIETLKLYVQSQQTKAALKGGVSTQRF